MQGFDVPLPARESVIGIGSESSLLGRINYSSRCRIFLAGRPAIISIQKGTRLYVCSGQLNMSEMLYPPVTAQIDSKDEVLTSLELQDGTVYQGYSFGAKKSVAGELVFQTGMVGYPESITDPSYCGQILVITFPLVGNYGVPSRETTDDLLKDLPAHFESPKIHIAGLITASYSGEDFSHFLAISSLGTWLKEQGVPAIYGVDTRALTKRIREEGSMLGRLLLQISDLTNGQSCGLTNGLANGHPIAFQKDWRLSFDTVDWVNPNEKNLVADGESILIFGPQGLTSWHSLDSTTQVIFSKSIHCSKAPLW